MRLTLHLLWEFCNGRLAGSAAAEVARAIAEQPSLARLTFRLGSFHFDRPPTREKSLDALTLAAYLDETLSPEEAEEFIFAARSHPATRVELAAVQVKGLPAWSGRVTPRPISANQPPAAQQSAGEESQSSEPAPQASVEELHVAAMDAATCMPPPLSSAGGISLSVTAGPPPVISRPMVPAETTSEPLSQRKSLQQVAGPMLTSAVVHLVLIVVLGLILLPAIVSSHATQLVVSLDSTEAASAMEAATDLESFLVSTPTGASEMTASAVNHGISNEASADPTLDGRVVSATRRVTQPVASSPNSSVDLSSNWDHKLRQVRPPTRPEEGLAQAAGVEDAVDGILSKIKGELDVNDKLLVVWLLDASLSLYDDRQIVAAKIEPFYRQFNGQQRISPLVNAAVAYGRDTIEIVDPTPYGMKIVNAVATVPIDPSGLENVMTTIEICVTKYRYRWRGPMMFVIWTDESGDDILRLEETIRLCRQEGVVVHAVGPSAVFGAERGSHLYVDQPTGYRFLVPIKRGPDSSLPERPWLPYWFEQDIPPWSQQGGVTVADAYNTRSFGGMYREKLLSGIGPYALTRLALQTGGTYTILDDRENGGPFSLADQIRYLPDYGPVSEHLREFDYHPMRRAIIKAVEITYKEQPKLVPPTFAFSSGRLPFYPFTIQRSGYIPPPQFRATLRPFLIRAAKQLEPSIAAIEEAIGGFGTEGMEEHYEKEKSPRWRAWYDLTLGRLMATSVRQHEYVRACEMMFATADFLKPDTNHIRLRPSPTVLNSDARIQRRTSEAIRLLQRCVEQNPNTPWAALAEWELGVAAGITVEQIAIPEPKPVFFTGGGGPSRPPAPVPRIPNF